MGEKIAYKLRKDFTGQKFGMLTVIDLAYIRNNRSYWYLKCDCGKRIKHNWPEEFLLIKPDLSRRVKSLLI